MHNSRRLLVIFLIAAMLGIFFVSAIAKADSLSQESESALPCFSLDVVFIIDQSGSMGGDDYNLPSDPSGQRAFGPRWAIDWLTDNALDICPDAFHRIAMISFGTRPNPDLELSDINPTNVQEWTYLRKTLKENIQLRNLGDTDPKLAFDMAYTILDQAGPVGDIPRKRVIIFMTDGLPCVTSLGCVTGSNMDYYGYALEMKEQVAEDFPFDSTILKQESCLDQARAIYGKEDVPPEVTNKCLEDYRINTEAYQKSTYLWTLLLAHGKNWPQELKDVYSDMSTSHGGNLVDITENRNEIPTTFMEILTGLAGVPVTRLTCGNFAVNPLVRQARLTFFKLSEDTQVRISYTDVSGVDHDITNGTMSNGGFNVSENYSEGANERYVFDFPYPGIWRIESDACQGIDAFYDPVHLNVSSGLNPVRIWNPQNGDILVETSNLPNYDQEPYYDANRPYYIQYQMRDTEGSIISNPEGDLFGIMFEVGVTDPLGNVESYDMEWRQDQQRFISTKPLLLPIPGDYEISLSGEIHYKEFPYGPLDSNDAAVIFGTQLELFNYENVIFHVFDVHKFAFELVSSNGNSLSCNEGKVHATIAEGWPLKITPISVRVRLINEDGSPMEIDPADILTNPDQALKAWVSQGDRVSEIIILKPDPNQPGEFYGEITEFDAVGELVLSVSLVGDYTEDYRPSKMLETSDGLGLTKNIQRCNGFLTNPNTYLIAFYLVLAWILIKIISCIINSRNPVNGGLTFVSLDKTGTDETMGLRGKLCRKNRMFMLPNHPLLKTHPEWDIFQMRVDGLPAVVVDEDTTEQVVRVRIDLVSETSAMEKLIFYFFPNWRRHWNRDYKVRIEHSTGQLGDNSTISIHYS